jgi:hypothetical protein
MAPESSQSEPMSVSKITVGILDSAEEDGWATGEQTMVSHASITAMQKQIRLAQVFVILRISLYERGRLGSCGVISHKHAFERATHSFSDFITRLLNPDRL